VKMKYMIVAVLVVIVGIVAAVYLFPSEKRKVKKQFDFLSEWVSKDPGENPFTMAQKVKSIGTLFAKNCRLKAHIESISGTYSREEITSYAVQGRLYFSDLSLKFYDHKIEFPEKGIAKVTLTAKLTGKSKAGEHIDEAHELECILKKIENKWLFTDFEVVEVLKK
jgi:hypothetical protein